MESGNINLQLHENECDYNGNISENMIENPFCHGMGGPRDCWITAEKIGEYIKLDIHMQNVYLETPPIPLVFKDGKVRHILSTGRANIVTLKENCIFHECREPYDWSSNVMVTWPPMYTPENAHDYLSWNMDPDHKYLWNRTYYGVMGAVVVPDGEGGEILAALTHGENKNGTFGPDEHLRYTTNTVEKWNTYENPADGTFPRPHFYEFDRVYYGMVGMACCNVRENSGFDLMKHDMGPIVWPSAGYLDDDEQQICYGPRHPYGIVSGGYIYIYYIDDCPTKKFPKPGEVERGRMFGVKVARAPISDLRPESFMLFFENSFSEKALPDGFNRFDRSFVYKKGGRGDIILAHPSGSPVVRFAVAKINNTDYYLGISYDRLQNRWLWLSNDLVHFSRQIELGPGPLMYPLFYNKDFTSTTAIDLEDFHIGGTVLEGDSPSFCYQNLKLKLNRLELT